MPRLRVLLSLVMVLAVASRLNSQAQPPFRPNATPAEVREKLGPPDRVARQIVARRYVEQWEYDKPPITRVEFIHVRGSEPQLVPETP